MAEYPTKLEDFRDETKEEKAEKVEILKEQLFQVAKTASIYDSIGESYNYNRKPDGNTYYDKEYFEGEIKRIKNDKEDTIELVRGGVVSVEIVNYLVSAVEILYKLKIIDIKLLKSKEKHYNVYDQEFADMRESCRNWIVENL